MDFLLSPSSLTYTNAIAIAKKMATSWKIKSLTCANLGMCIFSQAEWVREAWNSDAFTGESLAA